jgi:hypothetical protein
MEAIMEEKTLVKSLLRQVERLIFINCREASQINLGLMEILCSIPRFKDLKWAKTLESGHLLLP